LKYHQLQQSAYLIPSKKAEFPISRLFNFLQTKSINTKMRIKKQANHIRQQKPIHWLLQTLCLFFLIICCTATATATATATDSSRSCTELHSQKHLHRHECIASKETEAYQKSRTFLPIRGGENQPSAAMEGLKNSMASALASACAKSLLQPFDTIKTVQQHARSDISIGFLEAGRMVMEREGGSGFLGLYAGLAVAALGSAPSIGLYYGIYSYCKRKLIPYFQSLYGSKSTNGKQPVVSDQALKLAAVAVSAAIGKVILVILTRFVATKDSLSYHLFSVPIPCVQATHWHPSPEYPTRW
jgi:hypothetical protein